MRIISILVTLLAIFTVLTEKNLAAETKTTNETKINSYNGLTLENGKINTNIDSQLNKPISFYEKRLITEFTKREKKLLRYRNKLKNAKLPEKPFVINASAYTAAADECGKNDGITASGVKVLEKRTLACPPQFPFGAKIKIEGMGIYVCEDRGGAIKGNHFDIYMQTKKEAFAFGRKNLLAEVVN